MHQQQEGLWGYRELRAFTRLSEGTLRKWVRAGLIPCLRSGRVVRFIPDQVKAALLALAASGMAIARGEA